MVVSKTHPTRYWHRLEDGRVQCDVCPRACKLHEGQRGACFVRGEEKGAVVLHGYGRSSGFCLDPIEKKPLNHFLPGTSVLSFGTAGCNLACKFCQNWDMSKSREMDALLDEGSPLDLADAARRLGAQSIAYTYNDPVIFMEYAMDVAAAAHEKGIRNVAVTAGYIHAEPRKEFYRRMDAANIDLKGFTEHFYHDICGARLAPVLDTLQYVYHETSTWLEITTLLIPGKNDSPPELDQMTRWIHDRLGPEVPLHFTAFHPDYRMRDIGHTPHATLKQAREIAKANGLLHVYVGNVHDREGASSYCSHCGTRVIGREGYSLSEWRLDNEGACQVCGTPFPGVFNAVHGHWNAKRIPIFMNR